VILGSWWFLTTAQVRAVSYDILLADRTAKPPRAVGVTATGTKLQWPMQTFTSARIDRLTVTLSGDHGMTQILVNPTNLTPMDHGTKTEFWGDGSAFGMTQSPASQNFPNKGPVSVKWLMQRARNAFPIEDEPVLQEQMTQLMIAIRWISQHERVKRELDSDMIDSWQRDLKPRFTAFDEAKLGIMGPFEAEPPDWVVFVPGGIATVLWLVGVITMIAVSYRKKV
jgi:hypothetical protein